MIQYLVSCISGLGVLIYPEWIVNFNFTHVHFAIIICFNLSRVDCKCIYWQNSLELATVLIYPEWIVNELAHKMGVELAQKF